MSNHNGDHETREIPAEQLTAYALGQLHGDELAAVKAKLSAAGSGAALREIRTIQATAAALSASRHAEPLPAQSASLRELMEQRLLETAPKESAEPSVALPERRPLWRRLRSAEWTAIAAIFCACCFVVLLLLPAGGISFRSRKSIQARVHGIQASVEQQRLNDATSAYKQDSGDYPAAISPSEIDSSISPLTASASEHELVGSGTTGPFARGGPMDNIDLRKGGIDAVITKRTAEETTRLPQGDLPFYNPAAPPPSRTEYLAPRRPVPGRNAAPPGGSPNAAGYGGGYGSGDAGMSGGGGRPPKAPMNRGNLDLSAGRSATADPFSGPMPKTPTSRRAALGQGGQQGGQRESQRIAVGNEFETERETSVAELTDGLSSVTKRSKYYLQPNNEQYAPIVENRFLTPTEQPLSTFSIDVDTAAYANVRRFLTSGRLPPPDSVRIEELVNYFRYDYPQPKGGQPFSVNMEVAECPWREGHWLLRVGLKGREVERSKRPESNLVFLLDVSGSMADANKLPLLKTAMQMLVRELGENDRVSIVTYAGEAGLKLPPTRGHEQAKILAAIESLRSGGSTNGSAGIELAYEQASAHFVKGGTNRVILCTDGDLNVGVTSDEALVQLIKQKATGGTFLTVLGFGEGNLKDAKMEKLADNGNGLYAYIDSVREARKVLVEQLTGSTITIAKDVKIQIEFNPREIASYRLLGYENRVLAAEDFNNDKKDAGEIGAGHTVTALYELVPALSDASQKRLPADTDPLKYQQPADRVQGSGFRVQQAETDSLSPAPSPQPPGPGLTTAASTGELLTLKLRYKEPDGDTSKLLEYPLKDRGHSFHSASHDLQFAAAVASFGMILRGSEHRGTGNLAAVEEIASTALGADPSGYRAEFIDLVRKAQSLGAK